VATKSTENIARRTKLFLIEDDQNIREAFTLCLESEGYEVESFSNGKEALTRLHVAPEPCLILLDLMMPIMNGMEFMLEFTKFPATVIPVPVYLCSATSNKAESKRMGCTGFIKKPVDLEVLLKIVRDCCPTNSETAATVKKAGFAREP